ncbi:dynamin family protein, partial [Escherichia coli]|nr:dynamin family protein [Escherichia coli]
TILKNEQNKLANNEMVIAVVGTMKAGKSTTINAIAGTEVLPYRNRPMTALPTLIRHTKGLLKPVLRPQNQEPITNLCI